MVFSVGFRTVFLLVLAALLLPLSPAHADQDANLKQLRQQYSQAQKALQTGKMSKYRRLKKNLRDYPLYPYLEYAELTRRLSRTSSEQVLTFIDENPGTPLAARLHRKWLASLARGGRWQTLVAHYTPNDSKQLQCYYAKALLKTGQAERAMTVVSEYWLTGKSLPKACDPVIQAWHKSGELTDELVWDRIRLTMQDGRPRLARYLGRYLSDSQRHWLTVWQKTRRNPRLEFNDTRIPADHTIARWIRIDGLVRLSRLDAIEAAQRWLHLSERYEFQADEKKRINRHLALRLLRSDDPNADFWLKTLKLGSQDQRVAEWYIISALRDQDWETALAWIERLDGKEQQTERWRYWRGRVLEATGRLEEARSAYLLNTNSRGYYGFLSADHAGFPYRFGDRPLSFSHEELRSVHEIPGILRAQELFLLGESVNARREWHHALMLMDDSQLLKAAQLADQWGWHDRAIIAFGRARYWDDLERRFPLAHQELVLKQSKQFNINPAWAFAVIRQESAFTRDARSGAGAMGLMQLLPRTARQLARSLHIPMRSRRDLLNVRTNVRLGVGYLREVKDRFDGNKVLATAAYNAGGLRVKQWLPNNGSLPADVWVEGVPFTETRNYLKRVLSYTVIYEQRLGRTPHTMLDRMTPISAPTLAEAKPPVRTLKLAQTAAKVKTR